MPHNFRSPSMSFSLLTCIIVFSLCLYLIHRRLTRVSVRRIPGPKPESFWLGNLREFLSSEAGEADLKWQATYGDVVKFKATLGEDRLLVSDPKALQHIYHGYNFPKQPHRRELSRIISGRGILWAEGSNHRRQRRIMLPGFGSLQSKAYVPVFTASASRLVGKWKDVIAASPSQCNIINVSLWVSRATLDAIGEAAFDYNFSALENDKNILGKALVNLLMDAFATHTNASIFVQDMLQYLPTKILEYISDNAGGKVKGLRDTGNLMTEISKNLVDTKSEALLHGKSTSKDLMSILVRANASEKVNSSLTEEEMISMMRTVLLAGHETTANSLCWGLLDLAQNPHVQTRLRKEIWNMEKSIQERGGSEFTAADFEAMPYLVAVTKETLRYRPASYSTFRQAGCDDVLPLSKPIKTTDGTVITELPIPKGLQIITSINGYNRNTEIFGDDAHSYNPQRWLDETVQKNANIGPYANLLSFASGTRSCIGWRFAVLEMQAFFVELIGNFEFSLTPEVSRIKREACVVMIPLIEGEEKKGAQLPLSVKVAARD